MHNTPQDTSGPQAVAAVRPSLFRRLVAFASGGERPRVALEHQAGTPPADSLPPMNGPLFESVGNGAVRFVREWQEPVWLRINFVVTIPAGYVSDGYSIPRAAWLIVGHPFGQRHMIPAFVHDYLCDAAKSYEERVLADAVFFRLMHTYQVPRFKRAAFYVSVRCWGRYMWKLRGGNHA